MVKEIQSSHTQCKLTVMNANDSGALQLVLFNKRVITQHKSKWIGPSQRQAGICRGARARFWNRDILYFERYTFIVNVTTKRWWYLPCYTHYRRFPNRMVKFILPHHQQTSIHGLSETTVPPTNNNPGGVLFAIILIWAWDWASRWPAIFLWVRSGVYSSWE